MKAGIEADDGMVVLTLYGQKYPLSDWHFTFCCNLEKDDYALLAADHLLEAFNEHMEATRREAYEQGWKDAKAKRKKETWFRSCW